jgi:hypothetical protein
VPQGTPGSRATRSPGGGISDYAGGLGLDIFVYTRLESCYSFAAFEDDACGFVAEDTIAFYDERTDSTGFPEVNVGSIKE